MLYLKIRGSTYWYRRAIPKEIRAVLGRGGLWFTSLRTEDYTEAKRLCSAKNAEVEALFDAARKKIAPEPKAAKPIARSFIDFDSAQQVVADAVQDRERAAFQQITNHMKDKRKLESMKARAAMRRRLLLQPRDFDERDPAADQWKGALAERGYIVAPADGAFQFGLEKFRTELADAFRRVEEWAGRDFRDVPIHVTKPRGLTVMELFEAYSADRDAASRAADDDRPIIRLFVESIGSDIEAAKVNKAQVIQFKELAAKKPRNIKRCDRGLTLPQLVMRAEGQQVQRISPTSVKKYLATVKGMFAWAFANDKIPANPTSGVVARAKKNSGVKRKPRFPFSESDIDKIFGSPLFVGAKSSARLNEPGDYLISDHNYWLPLLALFSGARLTELGQLNIADVKQSQGGTWYLDITTEFDEEDAITHPEIVKQLKNESSIRKVPLHKTLIEMGFLDYVKSMKPMGRKVFPSLRADSRGRLTGNYSQAFGRWLRKIGIKSQTKVFHSFRHMFKDACRSAAIQTEIHDRLTGHALQGVGATYGNGHPVEVLAAAMNKIEFPAFVPPPERDWGAPAKEIQSSAAPAAGQPQPRQKYGPRRRLSKTIPRADQAGADPRL